MFDVIYKYTYDKLKHDNTGHGMDHIDRVIKNARLIIEEENISLNKDLILISCVVHDLVDHKLFENPEHELLNLIDFLKGLGYDEYFINRVTDIITNMSYSQGKIDYFVDNIEGQIVQDADRLDAIGFVGIIRTLNYGFSKNRSIYDSMEHFNDKLFKIPNLLNRTSSKKIADKKMSIMLEFYEAYESELL